MTDIFDGFEPDVVIGEDVSCYSAEKVRAIVEKAKSVRGGWQTIETAPKDGAPIMGCTYHPSLLHLYSPRRIYWAAYHPNAAGKITWRDAEICGNKLDRLTHWMPLPAAPKPEGE